MPRIRSLVLIRIGTVMLAPIGVCHARAPANTRDVASATRINAVNAPVFLHRLPTGRVVGPVGRINGTPNFATAVVTRGRTVYVLANGATNAQTITLYNARNLRRQQQIAAYRPGRGPRTARPALVVPRQNFFQGLAVGSHGRLYAAGGATNDVAVFGLHDGRAGLIRRYPLRWQPFPATQYPYQYQGHHVGKARLFYPDAVVPGRNGRHLYVTGMLANSLSRINLRTGHTLYRNIGPYPYAAALSDGGHRLIVSLWAGNGVAIVDPRTMQVLGRIAVGPRAIASDRQAGVHPTAVTAIPGSPLAFVTLANVDRVAEINTRTLRLMRILNDSPYRHAPPGSYPDALAIGGHDLFVANAGNNDVAVFDVRTGRPLWLIPTGWYPTALAVGHNALYAVAAKGLGSGPNVEHQWVGNMMHGLVQKIALPDLAAELPHWTRLALRHDGFSRSQRMRRARTDTRVRAFLTRHIHYVVFILRENKTFDEDLGDYRPAGSWADPDLDLYGHRELPNLYALARHNTLFVHFMADGEVTAQGHQWTTGASDSDFVQRTWPEYYSQRGLVPNPGWTQSLIPGGASGTGGMPLGVDNPYAIYENLSALGKWSNPWISYPGRLFLFNDLLAHHVSFEDFGEFVSRSRAGAISNAMKAHLAASFPGWDRMMLDTLRVHLAIRWLKAHPGHAFPHFIYIWLPDDHTAGRAACYYSPDYYVANNDYATAQFIHYLSLTPQWRHMVVFLTEDDAQSGADHINAHRTLALAIGPWVKRGKLEARNYSQVNILKTTERVFGLPPLSQWDQNARVFTGIWARHPDFTPTPLLPMRVPVRFNAGPCSHYTLLRREAGATGHILSPDWYRAHQDRHGQHLSPPREAYAPTTLLKVPGPTQMRQEWIAAKGRASYRRVQHDIAQYAARHHAPVAAFEAADGD